MYPLLKKNNGKINQTVTKIKLVLSIFPCLKYIYKSECVPSSPLLLVVKGIFYGRIGFYYLTNIYSSKFPASELTGIITFTHHNDFWIKSNEEHGSMVKQFKRNKFSK